MKEKIYCFVDEEKALQRFQKVYIDYLKDDQICFCDIDNLIYKYRNGKEVDFDNKILFPISGINQVEIITKDALSKGIEVYQTIEDMDTVLNWMDKYKLKRSVEKLKGDDLLDPYYIEYIKQEYGEEFFLKTLNKNFSAIVNVSYLEDTKSVLYQALKEHEDDTFFISEKIEIEEDKAGLKEYRCFVIDNMVRNISRFTDYGMHKIDVSIVKKALEINKEMIKQGFPKGYVVDLCEYTDKNGNKEIDVVEFNSIGGSGTYLYNSHVDMTMDNLEHSDIRRLPSNKKYFEPELQEELCCNGRASNYYNVQNTFANTIKYKALGLRSGHINTKKNLEEFLEESLGNKAVGDLMQTLDLIEMSSPYEYSRKLK